MLPTVKVSRSYVPDCNTLSVVTIALSISENYGALVSMDFSDDTRTTFIVSTVHRNEPTLNQDVSLL